MTLRFTKMHGLGNDFMVVELLTQEANLDSAEVRAWADRKTGIGFDQLLLIEATDAPGCDFSYRIYNADGSEVEHCGNGARCVPRFLFDQGLTDKRELTFAMARGRIHTRLEADGQVTVDMGPPELRPDRIPFEAPAQAVTYPLEVAGQLYEICAISMGNPHAVQLVDSVELAPVGELGPLIEQHPRFPARVNAGFMQVQSPDTIRLRVFERGAGETLACGTGACAAVVAGRLRGLLAPSVTVHTHGGPLRIEWQGEGHPVWMTGPATTVYEGQLPR
ncbi:MAG TPA: diaminopimelate epimerase [Hyphomicrobiales bacterium]|nr:diaminopimelate epimerase [Hyphomicrobiales bacterium]